MTQAQRVDESLQLSTIRLFETLDEEVMAPEREGAIGVERGRLTCVQLGHNLAERAVHLAADVVAVRRAPGVLDDAQAAVTESQGHDAVVDVVELREARLDLDRTGGVDRNDLVT